MWRETNIQGDEIIMYIVLHKNIRTITFITLNEWGGYKNDITNVVDSVWIDKYKTKSELLKFLGIYDLSEQYDIVKSSTGQDSINLTCDGGEGSFVEFTIIEI